MRDKSGENLSEKDWHLLPALRSARMIAGKDTRYKFFWVGNDQGAKDVDILLADNWVLVQELKKLS